ncbi:MAG: LacI family DNA-binding transcriptional regulator [Myxococcota bacterium]
MPTRVTMEDVARLAGVSPATVSRALNDSSVVSDATKERIRKIAEEQGYTVNATASSLRRQSLQTIGVVTPLAPAGDYTVSDPFFLEMVGAIAESATHHGYDLLLSLPGRHKGEVARRSLLSRGRADGMVIIGQAGRDERLNELADAGAPIVVWGGHTPGNRYCTVGSDNLQGGRLAVDHLLSLGRRRVLFLGDRRLPEVAQRYRGYVDGLLARGLTPEPELYREAPFAGEAARREMNSVLAAGLSFDAVFAASDMLALSASGALVEAGLRIPDDVAVVGYDDVTLASQVPIPLTTVSQGIQHGGRRLVELLLEHIGGGAPESELTPTRLVVRQSCGARS